MLATPRTEIVQSIKNNVKRPKPRHVELRVFDVGVDGINSDVGIECRCSMCRNLSISRSLSVVCPQVSNGPYHGFTLLHVLLSEEELAVEVRQVDSVKVQESNIPKPGHHHVLYW